MQLLKLLMIAECRMPCPIISADLCMLVFNLHLN